MPVVEMPNGDRVEFPDDMPRAQIRDLIATKFPEAVPTQQTGSADPGALRPAGITSRGLVEGAISGIGGLGSLPLDAAYNVGAAAYNNLIGGEPGDRIEYGMPVTGAVAGTAGSAADMLGLPQPGNQFERMMRSGAAGTAGALTGAGAGGLARRAGQSAGNALLERTGGAIAAAPGTQAIGGAGAGFAGQAAQEAGAGPLGTMAAGIAGGIGASAPIAAAGVAREAVRPFYQGGREAMVGRLMRESATDPRAAMDTAQNVETYVPGSQPTIGPATNDIGLMNLERGARRLPGGVDAFGSRLTANNIARNRMLDRVTPSAERQTARRGTLDAFAARETSRLLRDNPKLADLADTYAMIDDLGQRDLAFTTGGKIALERARKELDNIVERGLSPDERAEYLATLRYVRENPPPQQPQTLNQFLRSRGGIADVGGELKGIFGRPDALVRKGQRVGAVAGGREKGYSADMAARDAYDAGYIDDPEVNTLFAAIDDETRGRPAYAGYGDREAADIRADWQRNAERLRERGINPRMTDKSASQVIDKAEGDSPRALLGRLYSIRQNLADVFKDKSFESAGQRVNIGRQYKETKPILGSIDEAIEREAPGYQDYMREYGRRAGQMEQGEIMRGVREKVSSRQSEVGGYPLLNQPPLKRFIQDAKSSKDWKKLSPTKRSVLSRIERDLDRELRPESQAVRAAGSNTFQDMSTGGVIARAIGGRLPLPMMRQFGKVMYGIPEERMQQLLLDAIMDPKLGAKLMRKASPKTLEDVANEFQRLMAGTQAAGRVSATLAAPQFEEESPR